MRRLHLLPLALLACSVAGAGTAQAVPVLQLDIAGGHYDTLTQTIVASGSPFVLTAVLTPGPTDTAALLNQWFYVSAAISPATGPSGPNLGSIAFAGNTVNVTQDMTYGTPPIELYTSLQGSDPGDLPKHGIFPTYFSEFAFRFTAGPALPPPPTSLTGDTVVIPSSNVTTGTTTSYNTADSPGGLTPNASGPSYYASFQVDTSLLDNLNVLHFDLYSEDYLIKLKKCSTACTDVDVDQFAPFSHDAESGPPTQVPEASALSMMALMGLTLIGGRARRRGR